MTTSPLRTTLSGSLSPVASSSCIPKVQVTGTAALVEMLNRISGESVKVELKRKRPDGALQPISSKEIQRLDVTMGIDEASRVISGLGRDDKFSWCRECRRVGNAQFLKNDFSGASATCLQCLVALDGLHDEQYIREVIMPVLCNLASCTMAENCPGKAVEICSEAIRIQQYAYVPPTWICKALRRRAEALVRLGKFKQAQEDLRQAFDATTDARDISAVLYVMKMCRTARIQACEESRKLGKHLSKSLSNGELYADMPDPSVKSTPALCRRGEGVTRERFKRCISLLVCIMYQDLIKIVIYSMAVLLNSLHRLWNMLACVCRESRGSTVLWNQKKMTQM